MKHYMKRIAVLLVAALLIGYLSPAAREARAETTMVGDFELDGTTLVKYHGTAENVKVPDEVTTIGYNAFKNNTTMKSLYLGKNVTTIENYIVEDCTALTTIGLPEGDTEVELGYSAFSGANALTTVQIDARVRSINREFLDLKTLTEFVVDENNVNYFSEDGVLFYREGTNNYTLMRMPRNSAITDYVMPGNTQVKNIGDGAFSECDNLITVRISDYVETIRREAFSSCSKLTDVVMGKNVSTLESNIFYWCYELSSLTLSEKLTPETTDVYFVDEYLTTLYVPAGCGYVPPRAWDSDRLTNIVVEEGNKKYFSDNGVLYGYDEEGNQKLLCYPRAKEEESYKILEGTKIIGVEAFDSARKLKNIEMPDSLETIENYAFDYCDGITEMVLGKNVANLGYRSLTSMNNLTTLTLSEKMNAETTQSFLDWNNKLTTVYVPAEVTSLSEYVYFHSALKEIIVEEGNTSYFSHEGVLYGYDAEGNQKLLAYPKAKEAENYKIVDGTKIIGVEAFDSARKLKNIEMPDSLETIENYAFNYCDGITEMVLGKNVANLGYRSLTSMNNLTTLTLSEKMNAETTNSFLDWNDKLTTIYVPAEVTSLSEDVYFHASLKEIIVEEGNTSYFSHEGVLYGYDAEGNQKLIAYPKAKEAENYKIVDGTKIIGDHAFYYVRKLKNIEMPDSLETIENYAFYYCDGLTNVVLGKNVSTLGYRSLGECDNLSTLTLSEKLTEETGDDLFSWNENVTTLYVPANATGVPKAAYFHSSLENIFVINEAGVVDSVGTNYSSIDGVLYSADQTTLIAVPKAKQMTELVVPKTVTKINAEAAENQKYLTSVTLPAGLAEMGGYAFYGCKNLSMVAANGANPETIGYRALVANENVVVLCDAGSTVAEHAIYHELIYLCGENTISVDLTKKLLDGTVTEDELKKYDVTVYLGEKADESFVFPAFAAGDYILLPEGRSAKNGEEMANYSVVTVKLTHKKGECADLITTVSLDEKKNATVALTTVQNGKAAGQVASYADYTVSIYDADGKLVQTVGAKEDGSGYESKHLYAGDYTLIVLQGKIKNWIKQTPDAYESTGMTEGVDFVRRTVTIADGQITTTDITMPPESELASQWIDYNNTAYVILTSDITSDGLVNFRLKYQLKPEYAEYQFETYLGDSVAWIDITIPEGFTMHPESIRENGVQQQINADIIISENVMSIGIYNMNGELTFSGSPAKYGRISSSATMRFNYMNTEYEEYLGGVDTAMEYVTLQVAKNTESREVMVQGLAVPGSRVTVMDGGTAIGSAIAYGSGRWEARVMLEDSANPVHYVSAFIMVDGEKESTKEFEVICAEKVLKITEMIMYHEGSEYVADLENGSFGIGGWHQHGYSFDITMENAEFVDEIFVTSYKNGIIYAVQEASVEKPDGKVLKTASSGFGATQMVMDYDLYFDVEVPRNSDGSVDYGGYGLAEPLETIYVDYTMKELDETVDSGLAESIMNMSVDEMHSTTYQDKLPAMWQNAVATVNKDTRDADGYGELDFEVELDNEEKTVFTYHTEAIKGATKTKAELEADSSYEKVYGDDGSIQYIKYGMTQTYHDTMASTVRFATKGGGGSQGYTEFNMTTETHKFDGNEDILGSTIITESATALIGHVSDFGGAAATSFGFATAAVDAGGNLMDVLIARGTVNASGLPAAEKAARLAALDRLVMAAMITGALQYGLAVLTLGMALTPAGVPFVVGLVVAGITALMNAYINKFFENSLLRLQSFHPRWIIDPSGIVYEAVLDNPVEGATATVYYQNESGEAVQWNAAQYRQINPQVTGKTGEYAWDVPAGQWKVIVEKEGYQTVESDWLPVPPPQTDVNLGLISLSAPTVKNVHLYEGYAVVEFSQYIKVYELTAEKLLLDSDAVVTEVSGMNVKEAYENGEPLATQFKVLYAGGTPANLTVAAEVVNYAGTMMEVPQTVSLAMEAAVTSVSVEEAVTAESDTQFTFQFTVAPAEAAATANISVELSHPYSLELVGMSEPDAAGNITLTFNSIRTMPTTITIAVEGTDIVKKIEVNENIYETSGTQGSEGQGTTDPDPTPTPTPEPTEAPKPTETPEPTAVPTEEPEPTVEPTKTPAPTDAPNEDEEDKDTDAPAKDFPIAIVGIGAAVLIVLVLVLILLGKRKKKGKKEQ